MGLTFDINDEVLMITTPEYAESHLETMVYPVADLIGAEPVGEHRERGGDTEADSKGQYDFDSIIELITSTVKPTTWDAVGGPSSVAPSEHTLSIVVSQTQEVHEEIAKLLAELRRAGGLQRAKGYKLPTARPGYVREGVGSVGGMGGGMGGMMGGAAPMVRGHAAAKPAPQMPPANETAARTSRPEEQADLLKGVQESKRRSQGEQVEKLKGMYQSSGKGVRGGGVF
jgi:hypothetical protein